MSLAIILLLSTLHLEIVTSQRTMLILISYKQLAGRTMMPQIQPLPTNLSRQRSTDDFPLLPREHDAIAADAQLQRELLQRSCMSNSSPTT